MPDRHISIPDRHISIGQDTIFEAEIGVTKTDNQYAGYVRFKNGILNADKGRLPWFTGAADSHEIAVGRATRHWNNLCHFANLIGNYAIKAQAASAQQRPVPTD